MPEYHDEPRAFLGRPPTPWEEEFADTLLAIFGVGTHDLDGVVARLNQSRVKPPDGSAWTAERFQHMVKALGALT